MSYKPPSSLAPSLPSFDTTGGCWTIPVLSRSPVESHLEPIASIICFIPLQFKSHGWRGAWLFGLLVAGEAGPVLSRRFFNHICCYEPYGHSCELSNTSTPHSNHSKKPCRKT